MKIQGKIFDYINSGFLNGEIVVEGGRIVDIVPLSVECENYILPGLIDSHVHIESSMLTPSRFAELVVPRGTVAVVTDPHEIANVMGLAGVDYMIGDSLKSPLKCFFGAPSCVPASSVEASGCELDVDDVAGLLQRSDIWFLSEMMNFPGVVGGDAQVLAKVRSALQVGKPVDGHAPGLKGDDLVLYCSSGVSTDHECFSLEEALQKIAMGMKVQIRDGSAAKNFESLWPLVTSAPESVMLCTDDSHPDQILKSGHMDRIVRMGIDKGLSFFDIIRACCVNPVLHYKIPVGLLQKGDSADFIVVDSLGAFNVLETYIDGVLVAKDGRPTFDSVKPSVVNNFNASSIEESSIRVDFPRLGKLNVIEVFNGELVTGKHVVNLPVGTDSLLGMDVLKIVVLDRYRQTPPSVAFVKGFGLTRGAIASSVAHDNHNIVAVGCSDSEIVAAINMVVHYKGGIAVVDGNRSDILPLPIAGIISDEDGATVAAKYEALTESVVNMGSSLTSPFMTLSFMSLIVIPELKIGSKGLFDVGRFNYVSLFD